MALEISKKEFINYTLMYLLLGISGMPFFNGDVPMIGVFGLAFLIFLLRREGLHKAFFFYLCVFIIILLLHSLQFEYFPQKTYIGFIVKMTVSYLVVATLKQDFTSKYVNIIAFFAAVSFIFFIPLFISSGFDSIFNTIGISPPFEPAIRKSLILYQLDLDRPEGLYRNCGPFWEPAAFGGYLLMALMFNMAHTGRLKGRKNLLFIVTLLSTFSTTVYILLGIILFFYFFLSQTILVKLITVPVIAAAFVYAFFNLPFLNEKIMREIERGDMSYEMRKSDQVGNTRLSSAFADYNDFIQSPIIGRGIFELAFYDKYDVATRHNGLTRQIAQFGIIGSLFYFIPMFFTFKRIVNYSSLKNILGVIFFIIVLGMGIAEVYFEKPFFWGLFFLYLVIKGEPTIENELDMSSTEKTYA